MVVFFIADLNQFYCRPVSFKKIDCLQSSAVTVESPQECPTPTHTDTQFRGFNNQLQDFMFTVFPNIVSAETILFRLFPIISISQKFFSFFFLTLEKTGIDENGILLP